MSYTLDLHNLPTAPHAFDAARETQDLNERLLTRAYAMVAEAERLIGQQRQRIKTLENLSFTDELTGVLNRRGFEMALARELAAAQRSSKACGLVIMVDLDGFKQINDRFGHAAGDAYLQAIATFLSGALREGDVIGRLGGDEFAIILPNTRHGAGQRRAQQLQAQLHAASMPWKELALPLKASFGTTAYTGRESAADVLKQADTHLYADKTARKAQRQA